ncbi:MAG: hypothetical protein JRN11_07430 [Nitrososphaerota archaeon]|nr:hypothetical protein [Nitrososphaerota archaeon]MDG7012247.1 hypothetical protein [Nitrososphaerota archaeon]MDG7014318.1 hypothetical protein [Nitrososphaerota archaeon]MDG7026562.1 hypothetical protein [Nitrososphaerota archaeon]
MKKLTSPNYVLPLVVGSLKSMRVIHDPSGSFRRLKRKSEDLPIVCWRNAVRVGLEEMVEDLGRVRNAYRSKNWTNFQIHSPPVALEAALVHSSLRRKAVLTEKDLLNRSSQGYAPRFTSTLLTGAGMKQAKTKEVMNSLEDVSTSFYREAKDQRATPVSFSSALSGLPP